MALARAVSLQGVPSEVTPTHAANNGAAGTMGDRMTKQILLMTRPLAVSQKFVARLDRDVMRDVQVIYAPLIEIVKLAETPNLGSYSGVIFTSFNGVNFAPRGQEMTAFCVGDRTAKQAEARGWDVKIIQQDADNLVREIVAAKVIGPLAHLSGAHRRGDIAGRLAAQDIRVDVHVLYDQPLCQLTPAAMRALAGEVPVILPLFSPRTSAHLGAQVQTAPATTAIAISSAVARAAQPAHFQKTVVVGAPTGHNMVTGIEKLLVNNRLP